MKKFAITAAAATALTLTMASAFAETTQATQAPMMLAAGEVKEAAKDTKNAIDDTWITTKVKADLVTEDGIPGTDIKVETTKGVVSLSSETALTEKQIEAAKKIARNVKGVQGVSADGLTKQ